jgi:hypothetical protein
VDLQSGKFTLRVTDLSIGPLTLERSFLGGQTVYGNAHFGLNWSHNHSIHAFQHKFTYSPNDTSVVIAGKTLSFNRVSDTEVQWNGPETEGTTLVGVGGSYVFTDQQGNVYTFSKDVKALPPGGLQADWPNQRIARIDYANGHTVKYSYVRASVRNSSGESELLDLLNKIESNFGYAIVLERNIDNGYISKACGYNSSEIGFVPSDCGSAKLVVSYTYPQSQWPNVTSVTDTMGQKWGYTYVGTSNVGQLVCVKKVNSEE